MRTLPISKIRNKQEKLIEKKKQKQNAKTKTLSFNEKKFKFLRDAIQQHEALLKLLPEKEYG